MVSCGSPCRESSPGCVPLPQSLYFSLCLVRSRAHRGVLVFTRGHQRTGEKDAERSWVVGEQGAGSQGMTEKDLRGE